MDSCSGNNVITINRRYEIYFSSVSIFRTWIIYMESGCRCDKSLGLYMNIYLVIYATKICIINGEQ